MPGDASIPAVARRLGVPGRCGFALVAGLAVVAALVYADLMAAGQDIVIGTVVLGPLLCSVWGRPRDVALVGAVATACAVLSATWNDNITGATYVLRAGVVAVGSVVAVVASARRETVARDRSRFALLSAVAEIGTGAQTLEATAARVTELIVPAVADLCAIDVVTGGKLRRLAVRAHGGGSRADIEAALAAAPPAVSQATLPSGSVMSTTAQLTPGAAGRRRRGGISRDSAATLTHVLRVRSTVVVPLVTRGRSLGALTMSTTADSGRAYQTEDVTFAQVLAGRVALALDNAGLCEELGTIEAQLSAALSGLPEAVTIQSAPGALVYANDAAARLMDFTSPQELVAARIEDIFERFAQVRDDGRAIAPDEFPGRRVLAGQTAEPMVSKCIDRATGEERWLLTKATPVRDRQGGLALVVNVIDDITEVKRAERDQRLLAEAGEIFSGSLDHERMLQRVAELVIGALADGCALRVPDGRGRMRTVAVAHRDPARVPIVREISEREGDLTRPRTAASVVDAEPAAARTDEVTTLPMLAAGRPVGLLSLINSGARRRFTAADRALAEELAARTGAALEHTRLYAERSRIARTLQTGLLPDALPAMPGWEIRSLYRPVEGDENLVGGDFFDAIPVREGWLAVVGDVTGHGADAAPLTALARHTLRATAKVLDDPLQAIDRLNDELVERATTSLCTVGAAHLREHDGHVHVDVVCAGHPPALLIEGGDVRALGRHGPLLGVVPSPRWERVRAGIPAGAILVLYTDGVLDATGRDRERFGEQRLARTLTGATDAQDAITRIDRALRAFQLGRQADDTAVLAIERLPGSEG